MGLLLLLQMCPVHVVVLKVIYMNYSDVSTPPHFPRVLSL
jgi:hypothetical protein